MDLPPIKNVNLRESIEKVQRILRGLRVNGLDVPKLSPLVAFIVCQKLPDKLRMDWEQSNHDYSSYPSFEPMYTFLSNRAFAYETTSTPATSDASSAKSNTALASTSSQPQLKNKQPKFSAWSTDKKLSSSSSSDKKSFIVKSQPPQCVACDGNHYLNQCKVFSDMSVTDRFTLVKAKHLCIKCFNSNHSVMNCKRNYNCNVCKGNHHSLLHKETVQNPDRKSTPDETSVGSNPSVSLCAMKPTRKSVILSTAVVNIRSNDGKLEKARVLLDQGSETSLVRREFCNRLKLKLKRNPNPSVLIGINSDNTTLTQITNFEIASLHSEFTLNIDAEVINKIPYEINRADIASVMKEFRNLNIEFAESDDLPYDSVDILLGSEYFEHVFKSKRKFIENICIRESHFGYVISGAKKSSFVIKKQTFCGLSNYELNEQFNKFCRIEEVSESETKSENIIEHQMIEEHFESTYERDKSGRFVLRLPVKPSIINLRGSFGKARTMLIKSERRKSEAVRKAYCDFMSEYENLGHMTKLESVIPSADSYFIPHHMVTNLVSSSTQNRVVFNASYVDLSGTSLNDHLMNGPTLQPDLFDNVIRFRWYLIALCADIAKMYRQILIHISDRKFQRILWRYNLSEIIRIYELNTLTYGVKPASYMATKCLEVIARSIIEKFPEIAESILKEFYIDNYMSGAKNLAEAIHRQKIVHSTLNSFGFPLRKYQSNSKEFLNTLDPELIENLDNRVLGGNSFTYVLGLVWCPEPDTLHVLLTLSALPVVITKRIMLSDISKIFDVLGMLAPVTIKAKILLQRLWREALEWDDPVSKELSAEFLDYRQNLVEVEHFCIPRCYFSSENIESFRLIGFCDASTQAYYAVVYIRSVDNRSNVKTSFVCAKTRVAPLKALNIHRLELMAAVLLAQLIYRVCTHLKIDRRTVHTFSDSKTTLSWINFPVEQLKQFVSNRVSKILSLTCKDQWHYVDTKSNPADLATRGISAKSLYESNLWVNGPDWINNNLEAYISSTVEQSEVVPEIRTTKIVLNVTRNEVTNFILNKFSSFKKCVNVTAYIHRFVNKLKSRVLNKSQLNHDSRIISIEPTNFISVNESKESLRCILKLLQSEYFPKEYDYLSNSKLVPKRSRLKSLNVFLDTDGLIRVGGRLSASKFSYDTKYPIVIPNKSRFTELLVTFVHETYFHASKSFVINFLRSRYWIVGGISSLAKKTIRNCVLCTRISGKVVEQFMADLPKDRVTIARPFTTTGVDLSGAYTVKCVNHRSTRYNKVYIAFFVCFVTRAVHLELVEDLSTEGFLAAFERFISRRGLPSTMYSDNGTNFVGSRNILDKGKLLSRVNWKFIAPRSPHQGGLWESAVKSGKAYLFKAIGTNILSFVELNTVLIKIEAILNSRPIAYRMVNDISEPLTPGHFCIGSSLLDLPVADQPNVKLRVRYRLWRAIIESFWSSWRHAYLNQLQTRNKWKERIPNLTINDVVLLKSPNISVMQWPMGRIIEVFPDSNNIVRSVNVKTHEGIFRRAVQQLVRLPVSN